jgi:adenine-specific DNA-methyltransferase
LSRKQIEAALAALKDLGLPNAQLNDRSALVLLALLDLGPRAKWETSGQRLIGVTPVMQWIEQRYKVKYAPNSRETIRRETLHQFVQAGIVEYNSDKPDRPVNSPHAVYRISSHALHVLRNYRGAKWHKRLSEFQAKNPKLSEVYAAKREHKKISVTLADGREFKLSPGSHSNLIADIIGEFASRFLPGARLLYAGDTGSKVAVFDKVGFDACGLTINMKGKLPDVVLMFEKRKWLVLVEAVTSHGPVNPKRKHELQKLFGESQYGLVFVTAFPNEKVFARYSSDVAWETEVWLASRPDHMIHFNGKRFLGPY